MSFTILTQQEIDQIPYIIYKKILIEYNNVIEVNRTINEINIQNQYKINDLNKQIRLYESKLYSLNFNRSLLEIENEFYKIRIDSLLKILDIFNDYSESQTTTSNKDDYVENDLKDWNNKNYIELNNFDQYSTNQTELYNNIIVDQNLKNNRVNQTLTYKKEINNVTELNNKNNMDELIYVKDNNSTITQDYSRNNIIIINKLVKKIKSLTNKYKIEKRKYKKLLVDFTRLLQTRDQIYENLSQNSIDNKNIEENNNILNKYKEIEKEYFVLLDTCNTLEYNNNKLLIDCKSFRYKYDKYILSNREDIIPIIGLELETIKFKILDCINNCKSFYNTEIYTEYWKFINYLYNKIDRIKEFYKYTDIIREEIKNMFSIIKDVYQYISDINNINNQYNKDLEASNEIINDFYKTQITNNESHNYNYQLLEIHNYKKQIKKLEDNLIETEDVIRNLNIEISKKNEQIKQGEDKNNEKDLIISNKEEIIKKLYLIISKLKKIKDKYIELKTTMNK